MSDSKLNIARKSQGYNEHIDDWQKVRDVIASERVVKARRNLYLPKPTGMNPEQYKRYLARAVFFAVCQRTLRGLVGMAWRVEPTAELPDILEPMKNAATPDGQPLDSVAKAAVREVISIGRYGILVDMAPEPALPGEAIPYLATYTAESIWRWEEKYDPAKGKRVVTRLVLEEQETTEVDVTTTVLRELFLDKVTGAYTQQLWRRDFPEEIANVDPQTGVIERRNVIRTNQDYRPFGPPVVPQMQGKPLDEIPFWFVNAFDLTTQVEQPPMLALADMNLAHYRNSADLEQALHIVASPTPWTAANWADGETKPRHIGPGTIWHLPQGGSAGMLEFTGQGCAALREEMKVKEEAMAALGARLIQDQARSNVSTETTRLQASSEESVLTSGVQNVSRAMTLALKFAAKWAGAPDADIEELDYCLNEDFLDIALNANDLTALVAGWQSGAYSKQTLHENLQKGEIIPHDRDLEDEQELIDAEAASDAATPTMVPAIDPETGEPIFDPVTGEPKLVPAPAPDPNAAPSADPNAPPVDPNADPHAAMDPTEMAAHMKQMAALQAKTGVKPKAKGKPPFPPKPPAA